MISIIVPVYNAEKYLERCIERVRNQSYGNFELILVDDGSTDSSGEICDEFAKFDKRIKVIHKKNGGVSSARNAGLNVASGEWLIFFDADDSIPKDSLENFIEVAEKYNPDIIIGNYNEIYVDGNTHLQITGLPTNMILNRKEIIDKILIGAIHHNNFFGSCWIKMFKREIFIEHNLTFPARRRAEDWLLNINFLEHAKTSYVIDKAVYNYHRNTESAMSKCFPEQMRLWEENHAIKESLIEKYGYKIDRRRLNANFIEQVLWHCFQIIAIEKNSWERVSLIFENTLLSRCLENYDAAAISVRMRPSALLLKKGLNKLSYLYLMLNHYASTIKRRIKS